MKKKNYVILAFIAMLLISISCSSDDHGDFPQAASLKIVHSVADLGGIELRELNGNISTSSFTNLSFGRSTRFSLITGEENELAVLDAIDTLNVLYEQSLKLDKPGGIYSLYLVGQSPDIESLLIEDNYNIVNDSIVSVRFANLSGDSNSISLGITGNTVNELDNLAYKDFTEYLLFPAQVVDGTYNFEFKDNSGNVLATASLNPLQPFNVSVKKSLTLALIGTEVTGYSAARINNY